MKIITPAAAPRARSPSRAGGRAHHRTQRRAIPNPPRDSAPRSPRAATLGQWRGRCLVANQQPSGVGGREKQRTQRRAIPQHPARQRPPHWPGRAGTTQKAAPRHPPTPGATARSAAPAPAIRSGGGRAGTKQKAAPPPSLRPGATAPTPLARPGGNNTERRAIPQPTARQRVPQPPPRPFARGAGGQEQNRKQPRHHPSGPARQRPPHWPGRAGTTQNAAPSPNTRRDSLQPTARQRPPQPPRSDPRAVARPAPTRQPATCRCGRAGRQQRPQPCPHAASSSDSGPRRRRDAGRKPAE